MRTKKISINRIPALIWGNESDQVYIHVHGKMSRKEYAEGFAQIAEEKGFQTLSFDLPEHGERTGGKERCDVWNGVHDCLSVAAFADKNWKQVSLMACSIGAYFSLQAFAERRFGRCLFTSPIVDMEWLVRKMMDMAGADERKLEKEQEIPTAIDPLRWDYYRYILAHLITRWDSPTAILYGGKDSLQPLHSIQSFSNRFGAVLTVSPESEHFFMSEADLEITSRWLSENIR